MSNKAREKLCYTLASQGINTTTGIGATYNDYITNEANIAFKESDKQAFERSKENFENLQNFNAQIGEKRDAENKEFIGNMFSSVLGFSKNLILGDIYKDLLDKYKNDKKKSRELQFKMLLGNINAFKGFLGDSKTSFEDSFLFG